MEKVFEHISLQINESNVKLLQAIKKGENYEELTGSGRSDFNIPVDGQGNAYFEQKGYYAGKTVNAKIFISEPKGGVFDIDATSTGGGHISQKGVVAGGPPVQGSLKMELWGNTTIRIKVHSSIPNTVIKGRLEYSY